MNNTGFQLPALVVSNGTVTGNGFTNPDNILLVDGDVAQSNTGAGTASDITLGYVGNINLDTDSIVNGIEIKIIGYTGSQTSPQLTLTPYFYDNVNAADNYYPYDTPVTSLTTTMSEVVIGTSTYLFNTTIDVDQINNFKLNIQTNGDFSLDCVLVNVFYTPYTPPTPPTPTPGVCIDCSSPIQVQSMSLYLPFLAGETKFYLKPGSFSYPDGTPVQPGDIGSCGGIIPFVFDQGKRKAPGTNWEENAVLDTNVGSWTVLSTGVIEVDLGTVTNRGLGFKTPAAHDVNLMSDHDANSEVIISNNEPYNLQLVRRCQADTVFSPPITVQNEGVDVTTSVHRLDFIGDGVNATLDGAHNVDVTITDHFVKVSSDDTTTGYLADKLVAGTNVTLTPSGPGNETLTISATGGGGGGGSVDSVVAGDDILVDNTDPANPVVSVDTVALANDPTFITNLTANTTFQTFITSIAGGAGYQVDQTPDNGTYGLLAGTVNGSNKTFTVSAGTYTSGKLQVFLNGLIQLQGASDDWKELVPALGTFEFNTAPATGDIITVVYTTGGGGALKTASGAGTITGTGTISISTGFRPTEIKIFASAAYQTTGGYSSGTWNTTNGNNCTYINTSTSAYTASGNNSSNIIKIPFSQFGNNFVLANISSISSTGFELDVTETNYSNTSFTWEAVAGGAGSGIESVTGLNTDNTDPQNPIVKISVDGTTITGQGTPGSPLVASGGSGGVVFGNWDTSSYGITTTYQAPSDGILMLTATYTAGGTGGIQCTIYSDASPTPTTIVGGGNNTLFFSTPGDKAAFNAPIKKNDYFKIISSTTNVSLQVKFLPFI